jgi:hypothetical protein
MRLRLLFWTLFLSVALFGCANRVPLESTPLVPAADGRITISTDANNNTRVKLEVKHLAPPSALSPPRGTYVVWTRDQNGDPQKQGTLDIGDNRQGKIEFITSLQDFDVIVTAEESPDVRYPSSAVALRSEVRR